MDSNRALALIAVGGQPFQMQHIVAWKKLAFAGAVEQLVIACEYRFDLRRVQQLKPYEAELSVPINTHIAIAP